MLPRLLLPTARSAFALTLVAAAAGFALGVGRFQSPGYSTPTSGFALSLPQVGLPSFGSGGGGNPLPNFGGSAPPSAPEMQVHPDLLRLDDVLPLSRDLELDQARSGAVDNPQAAGAWPDSDAAARKLEEWGRTGGFQATFIRRRPGTPDNPIVQAWADVSTYRTSKGALDALNDLAARLMKQGATTITGASIGEIGRAHV